MSFRSNLHVKHPKNQPCPCHDVKSKRKDIKKNDTFILSSVYHCTERLKGSGGILAKSEG